MTKTALLALHDHAQPQRLDHSDDMSPRLRAPTLRSEAEARAARIERDIRAHIDALTRSGALDREIASEITAKVHAVCS